VPTKLQIGRQLKKRKNKKKKKNRENRIERELQILEKTNNAPVAIYLESTVGSCCVLDMLFLSLSYTNGPEDWKEHNLLDSKHHQKVPGKQKGNTPALQFGLRTISLSSTIGSCSFLDMWCA